MIMELCGALYITNGDPSGSTVSPLMFAVLFFFFGLILSSEHVHDFTFVVCFLSVFFLIFIYNEIKNTQKP